jgi:class 3 adenylate cyclase/tetratricopeptide (TPR) repeat protein
MKCSKCHIENPNDNKFCRECGTALLSVCSECGSEFQAGDKFCGKCGQKVVREAKEETTQLTSEGERKHVTVLFSDLSGYTAMSEKLDPEEVKEITGKIFGEISKIIAKYDGFVEKYAGDAVMALFGADLSHEDDPVRAVRAAIEIHGLIQEFSPRYEDRVGGPLSMHTGINTGLVVTGELNMEKGVHGVAGDTVNVAARLSGAAEAGDILVDHETCTRVEGYFEFEDLEPIQLKGKTESIQIHKFLSLKDKPQKIHRLHGLRADLIGRKAEMAQFAEAVANLKQGRGSVISVIGAAGTGKSRLVQEFKSTLDSESIQWLEGHAYPYSQNIPYFLLIDLFNRVFQIKEGDSAERKRQKIEAEVAVLVEKKEDAVPYIGSLYSLSYPEVDDVSPEFWKSRLQELSLTIISNLAKKSPTVFCLEDLHWADLPSVELLRNAIFQIRQPAIVLCVYRPAFTLFTGHQTEALANIYHEIHLQDLSPSETQDMLESLLQFRSIPSDLKRFVREKAEGNPFYLEEMVNSLIESATLSQDADQWKVTRPIIESEISSTINGLISGRLDRLEKETKRILQEASVIGRSFLLEILEKITELKHHIDRSLRGLEQLDLIRTRSLQPQLEYIFKHALTQEVVYNGLLKKERRKIHERIGLVMEQLFDDRLPELYETLAFHFTKGLSTDKAVEYLMKSGEKSLKRYALDEAHQNYRKAFELLTQVSDMSLDEKKRLIHLLVEWAMVFYYRADFKGLNELFSVHEDIAADIGDDENAGMFFAWLGFALSFRAKQQESYQYLHEALNIGEKIKNPLVIGYACTWLPLPCVSLGLLDEGINCGNRAKEISRSFEKDQYLNFKSRAMLGYVYFFQGNSEKTHKAGKTVLDYGRRHSNIRSQVMGLWIMSFGYILESDSSSAIECLKEALEISEDPFYSLFVKLSLGTTYASAGKAAEAEEILNEVISFSKKFGCEFFVQFAIPYFEELEKNKAGAAED